MGVIRSQGYGPGVSASYAESGIAESHQARYVIAYDICDPRRARRVLRSLGRWRADGQLSVHETCLQDHQVQELVLEMMGFLDRRTDRMLVCRVHGRSRNMIPLLSRDRNNMLFPQGRSNNKKPVKLHNGWYMLAYDIADASRLQKIQRVVAKACCALQRSVYLYHGSGKALSDLSLRILQLAKAGRDDVRIYRLAGPSDIWFPSGPLPSLPGMVSRPDQPWWRRLLNPGVNHG